MHSLSPNFSCHFVVDESQKEKYLVNTVDPDVLVDWQHILLAVSIFLKLL